MRWRTDMSTTNIVLIVLMVLVLVGKWYINRQIKAMREAIARSIADHEDFIEALRAAKTSEEVRAVFEAYVAKQKARHE